MSSSRNVFLMFCQAMRLGRLEGVLLLFWPCLWGHILAHQGAIVGKEILILALGAWWARSVGCLYNDWIDAPYDGQVQRTRNRPFTRVPLSPAAVWIAVLGVSLSSVLWLLFLPAQASLIALLGAAGTLIYPLLKRWIQAPQVFLALLFNLGLLMAFKIAGVPLPWGKAGIFYLFGVLWTIEYDTLYGYQDYLDDFSLGLKSLPLWLGYGAAKPFLYSLCLLRYALLSCWKPSFSLLIGLSWALSILSKWDPHSPSSCAKAFSSTSLEGLFIAAWLILS